MCRLRTYISWSQIQLLVSKLRIKKVAFLTKKLEEEGMSANRLASLHAPAGLDLGAITPDEIAFSIVGELIAMRRRGQRNLEM